MNKDVEQTIVDRECSSKSEDDVTVSLKENDSIDESTDYSTNHELSNLESNELPDNLSNLDESTNKRVEKSDRSMTVQELNLSEPLLNGIQSLEIEKLTDLQANIIPTLLDNRTSDFIIKSKLHSGKKTAFLIAALERIDLNLNYTQVIIVEPTNELVYYTVNSAKELAKFTEIKVNKVTVETEQIPNDHLIVLTLGTLIYRLKHTNLDIGRLNLFIFDEFNLLTGTKARNSKMVYLFQRLVDWKFQILYFLNCANKLTVDLIRRTQLFRKQNLIFLDYLNCEEMLANFFQFYVDVKQGEQQLRLLVILIENIIFDKIVLFADTVNVANTVNDYLKERGFKTILLTSKSKVNQRLNAIERFNLSTESPTIFILNYPLTHGILGSLSNISMVINYNLPFGSAMCDEYLHKICICSTTPNDKPAFVVNFFDLNIKKQASVFKKLNSYFKCKFINLDLTKN